MLTCVCVCVSVNLSLASGLLLSSVGRAEAAALGWRLQDGPLRPAGTAGEGQPGPWLPGSGVFLAFADDSALGVKLSAHKSPRMMCWPCLLQPSVLREAADLF